MDNRWDGMDRLLLYIRTLGLGVDEGLELARVCLGAAGEGSGVDRLMSELKVKISADGSGWGSPGTNLPPAVPPLELAHMLTDRTEKNNEQ